MKANDRKTIEIMDNLVLQAHRVKRTAQAADVIELCEIALNLNERLREEDANKLPLSEYVAKYAHKNADTASKPNKG